MKRAARKGCNIELESLRKRLRKTRAQNRELQAENWELRFDPLSGLDRRQVFFKDLNRQIEQLLGTKEADQACRKETITPRSYRLILSLPLTVTFADIAYLSKFNEDEQIVANYMHRGPHGGGDELIEAAGRLIQEPDPSTREVVFRLDADTRGGRLAGDEIGLQHCLRKSKAVEVATKLQAQFGQIQIQGSDLAPAIDLGLAHISEGWEVFMLVFTPGERRQIAWPDRAKRIQECMTAIADRRAALSKAIARLRFLVQLYQEKIRSGYDRTSRFDRNFDYLHKGALRLSKEQVSTLNTIRQEKPDYYEISLRSLVRTKLSGRVEKKGVAPKLVANKIIEVADREWF